MEDILAYVREKISCPQFGDDHYGEWGALPLSQRKTIKRLLDYSVGQEEVINRQKAEKEALIAGQETLQKYIAEQKTEIERLTNQKYRVFIPARGYGKTEFVRGQFRDLKAEAIKEFAERLKSTFPKDDFLRSTKHISKQIDNLVKEMVGDE